MKSASSHHAGAIPRTLGRVAAGLLLAVLVSGHCCTRGLVVPGPSRPDRTDGMLEQPAASVHAALAVQESPPRRTNLPSVERPSPPRDPRPSTLPSDGPVDPGGAYSNAEWVGVLAAGADCAGFLAGGRLREWTVRPLVDVAALRRNLPRRSRSAELALRELARFCHLEPPNPATAVIPNPLPPGFVALGRDAAAVAPMQANPCPVGQTVAATLHGLFLREAGAYFQPRTPLKPAVHLAVLDTQPTGSLFGPANSSHGRALIGLAQELTCPPDRPEIGCAAELRSRLALPLREFDPLKPLTSPLRDDVNGGLFGTLGDVAGAIFGEVGEWALLPEPRPHLILNLSFGWDGALFGGRDEPSVATMPPPAQAVYRALELARALDVLVIAAAGNDPGGPGDAVGALIPGHWEARPPGDRARQRPLVYAVGGVQASGQPLANTRPLSLPARLAFGGPAGVRTSTTAAEAQTGTSVATVVVASAAAVVWSLRPTLTAAEVMTLVDESASRSLDVPISLAATSRERLPRRADEARRARAGRVTVSGAALAVCPATASAPPCQQVVTPAPTPTFTPLGLADLAACPAQVASYQANPWAAGAVPKPCGAARLWPLASAAGMNYDRLCYSDRYHPQAGQRWSCPQPDSPPCPSCVAMPPPPPPPPQLRQAGTEDPDPAANEASLWIEIDPKWKGPTGNAGSGCVAFDSLVVTLTDRSKVSYPLDVGWLCPGDTRKVTLIPEPGEPWKRAVLSGQLANGMSVENPVWLAERPE